MISQKMKSVLGGGLSMTVLLLLTFPLFGKGPKMDPHELVEKHLQSIGKPEALAAMKICTLEGIGVLHVLTGGSGFLQGPLNFISSGDMTRYTLKFNYPSYPSEEFAYDGKDVEIGYIQPGQRSSLGNFLYSHKEMISEGLLGGVLSTAWPLEHLDERKAKLQVRDLKKIEGQELYEVRYQPKKRGDLTISLYFDPKTFRHVMSVYEMEVSAGIVSNSPNESANQRENRYRIEETFDNFMTVNGLTLPAHWKMQYTIDSQHSRVTQWDMTFNKVTFNQKVDPKLFSLQ